jgi:hypothetical protein
MRRAVRPLLFAAAYRELSVRTLEQRREQFDVVEGLGFAAGRNHPGAGPRLAAYFKGT